MTTDSATDHRPDFAAGADPLFGATIALDRGGGEALVLGWSADWRMSPNPDNGRRYPWSITTFLGGFAPYVPPEGEWAGWRPSEEPERRRDPRRAEDRLLVPMIVADTLELLERLADEGSLEAAVVRDRTLPVMRRDFARFAMSSHAWSDSWALWNLARRPRALRRLHAFALAIADACVADALAHDGLGTGSRFPFHGVPMVSISAQLASGLLALGIHPNLTGRLAAWVAGAQRPDGAWADATEPPDPLTTLVAADLLAGLEPAWDPDPVLRWLEGRRRSDGTLVAYGPEVAWLTLAVDGLVGRLGRPFARRFRWPQLAVEQRDRKTGLPFLGYLADLARLFAEVPSLASSPVEVGFLDLAGFGAWNNQFGMAKGDEVLRVLADELDAIPDAVAIRDGGDEFLVVGAPGLAGLPERLDAFRLGFPGRMRERFGPDALPVPARVVTTVAPGARLIEARDALGIAIANLKGRNPSPPPEGVTQAITI